MSVFVKVKDGDFAGALRIFKKKVNEAGIMRDLRAHESYLTKSQKARVKHKEALRRKAKLARMQDTW